MGSVTSKAADGVGTLLGNAFTAPFKAVFGASCKDVCSGTWDVACFVEHFCVSNLLKLLMILGLCYIILVFFYLLFKIGICQCIAKSLCNMSCALCKTYWYALEDMTCFLWHKLTNVKRVNRRRRHHFRDVELGYSSTEEKNKISHFGQSSLITRKRKLFSEGKHTSAYPSRLRTIHVGRANNANSHHNQYRRSKKKHIKRLRQVQTRNKEHCTMHTTSSKRRRII